MKTTSISKSTFREIRQSFGRFAAILAIVALGVGLFAGLKVTKQAMLATTERYLEESRFFDYRLLSTFGFDEQDIELINDGEDILASEGAFSYDILYENEEGREGVVKIHSITDTVNQLRTVAGRLPQNPQECVVDAKVFSEAYIGQKLRLSEHNEEENLAHFSYDEYTVVGTVQSPCYIQFERGNTALGSGRIDGFVYLLPEGFAEEIYTEVYVKLTEDYPLYSAKYRDYIEKMTPMLEDLTDKAARRRFESLPVKPDTYVLDRNTNVGYVCFENDSCIVEGIANVFPVFFFLVAALVCITTMSRLVEEQRTQIGVLKALGYSNGRIMSKYITYSGLAAILGAFIGYFGGTWLFPQVLWVVYGIMYSVDGALIYVFDTGLALISLVVSLLCSVGTTWLCVRSELREVAAQLMRPKAPKAGKRVFLEYLPFLWKRLSFLKKVSLRNVFRYKKRFIMMILGISGCTALLVTGFGIKDSIVNVATQQFQTIQIYDIGVSFSEQIGEKQKEELEEMLQDCLSSYLTLMECAQNIITEDEQKSVNLIVTDQKEEISNFIHLHTTSKEAISYPGKNEAVITQKVAKELHISAGDTILLRDDDMRTMTLVVKEISENFIYNYVYIDNETYTEQLGSKPESKTLYLNVTKDTDVHKSAAQLMKLEGVSGVTVNADTMERITNMLNSLDLIVLVIIICAAGLAFIVLYNLTNINITERIREIATIKVLGFYKKETSQYVFRENLVLTFFGTLLGLPLGKALHLFVMNEVNVDMIAFDIQVLPLSYLISILLTFVFALAVNKMMGGKLEKISMTESLKSVD